MLFIGKLIEPVGCMENFRAAAYEDSGKNLITYQGGNAIVRNGKFNLKGTTMSFAEKILDGMVDENGHCGERGLSEKQFGILSENLQLVSSESAGGWQGSLGKFIEFTIDIYEGFIGKYHVKLQAYHHFHTAYTVVFVEKWIDEFPDLSKSEYAYTEKTRVDIDVLCIKHRSFSRCYDGWNVTQTHVYTFVDDSENCFVWFASKDQQITVGGKYKLRATVKCHNEYKGIKQTVVTRGKIC